MVRWLGSWSPLADPLRWGCLTLRGDRFGEQVSATPAALQTASQPPDQRPSSALPESVVLRLQGRRIAPCCSHCWMPSVGPAVLLPHRAWLLNSPFQLSSAATQRNRLIAPVFGCACGLLTATAPMSLDCKASSKPNSHRHGPSAPLVPSGESSRPTVPFERDGAGSRAVNCWWCWDQMSPWRANRKPHQLLLSVRGCSSVQLQ